MHDFCKQSHTCKESQAMVVMVSVDTVRIKVRSLSAEIVHGNLRDLFHSSCSWITCQGMSRYQDSQSERLWHCKLCSIMSRRNDSCRLQIVW